jgi:peptide/nickel transport system permease protein
MLLGGVATDGAHWIGVGVGAVSADERPLQVLTDLGARGNLGAPYEREKNTRLRSCLPTAGFRRGTGVQTYLLKRTLSVVPSLLGICVLVFLLLRLIPGDVVDQMLGAQNTITEGQRQSLRHFFGLDQPLPLQFWDWIRHVAVGDLGASFRTATPVSELILSRVPVTLELTLFSMLIGSAIGLSTGVVGAVWRNSVLDDGARLVSLFGLSIPEFWQGTMLLLITSLWLHWIPPVDYVAPWENPLRNVLTMLLPALSLGTVLAANVTRMTRSAMLDVLNRDYVRTARAKGLVERTIIVRHALKNALIPVITVSGLQVGYLLGGAVIVEQVFTLPGIGRLLLDSIYGRDYPVVQGTVLVVAFAFVLVNLIVDLLYAFLDPRISYA